MPEFGGVPASPLRTTGTGTGTGAAGAGQTPLSPLPAGLASPSRRINAVKQNVYVSPMRSDKAAASHMTPRTKSLFAFVGKVLWVTWLILARSFG